MFAAKLLGRRLRSTTLTPVRSNRSHNRCVSDWMRRHVADPHVRASVRDEYRSRAAYKLIEINTKLRLIRPGASVVDLGSAPGSWTQVAVQAAHAHTPAPIIVPAECPADPMTLPLRDSRPGMRNARTNVLGLASAEVRSLSLGPSRSTSATAAEATITSEVLSESAAALPSIAPAIRTRGSTKPGRVVAVDLAPMIHVAGSTFLQGDFREAPTRRAIRAALGASAIDVVLSDMAHSFVGSGTTDHTLQMQLAWTALIFATQNLASGGNVAIKTRYGDEYRPFTLAVKGLFSKVRRLRTSPGDIHIGFQCFRSTCSVPLQMVEVKPPASRAESAEAYVVGLGFSGAPGGTSRRLGPQTAGDRDARLIASCLAGHGLSWGGGGA